MQSEPQQNNTKHTQKCHTTDIYRLDISGCSGFGFFPFSLHASPCVFLPISPSPSPFPASLQAKNWRYLGGSVFEKVALGHREGRASLSLSTGGKVSGRLPQLDAGLTPIPSFPVRLYLSVSLSRLPTTSPRGAGGGGGGTKTTLAHTHARAPVRSLPLPCTCRPPMQM